MSSRPHETCSIFDYVIIGGVAAIAFAGAASVALAAPERSETLGVVFAPWIDAASAIDRSVSAGARFVRFGGANFVVVVQPDDADFRAAARKNGALFFVDPRFAGACLSGERNLRDPS